MADTMISAGGGLSKSKLALANAALDDVLSGKTFYAGDKSLKTGTMHNNGRWPDAEKLTLEGSKIWMYQKQNGYLEGGLGVAASNLGNASPGHVLSGVSASSSNGLKFNGTMANRGAVSASVDPGGSYTIPAGYHNGSGHISGNRKYNTVYLGQQDSPWTAFSYNVKSHYPSIYNKLSRNNFIAIPHKYDGSSGEGGYRNTGNCGDFISYNASTGVVTMNGFGVGTQGQIRMTVMFKLYMIY